MPLERPGMSGRLAVVDAHHHVWDPDVNYHPWLRDKPVSGFRYGDYAPIRRRYLVPDYLADAKSFHVAGFVFFDARWGPTGPVRGVEDHQASGPHEPPSSVSAPPDPPFPR